MAKYYGKIGFAVSTETAPGVWSGGVTEKSYSGDVVRNSRKLESGEGLNDDLTISNRISIITDQFADENLYTMKYLVWRGIKWKISSIDVKPPRHILTLGGLYNG